jgi:chaperone required for assembly of F1-ATPase
MHVPQPVGSIDRLAQAVAALNAYQLAGLSPLVTVGGSLIAALAVFEGAIAPEDGWLSVSVDDRWQLEQWGSDADAELAVKNHHADFLAGARFLELLGDA